jgi:hypothetical protein
MKTWFCKQMLCKGILAAAVACLTFLAASPPQAAACSNASLKGQYGQTISGQILPGNAVVLPQNGVAMTNFDGNGKFTQVDFVVIDGTNQSSKFQVGETGTYKVNSDCTGSARINYKGNDGSWIDLELVVVNQGREFRTVVSSLYQGGNEVPANIGSSGMRVDNADGNAQTATR